MLLLLHVHGTADVASNHEIRTMKLEFLFFLSYKYMYMISNFSES